MFRFFPKITWNHFLEIKMKSFRVGPKQPHQILLLLGILAHFRHMQNANISLGFMAVQGKLLDNFVFLSNARINRNVLLFAFDNPI